METLVYTHDASLPTRGAIARLKAIKRFGRAWQTFAIGNCICHNVRWYECPLVNERDIINVQSMGFGPKVIYFRGFTYVRYRS